MSEVALNNEGSISMPMPDGGSVDLSFDQSTDEAISLSPASLYVGELDPSVTESILFELFSMCGNVASIRVCRDAVTRRSLGYAYVNYHLRSEAERAIAELNYTGIKNKPCRIMWSQRDPSLRKTGSGNIFIKNLDPNIDNKALHDTFSAFGNILSCKVVLDRNGVSRGYGFVHYESEKSAADAIEKVNGMLLNDRKVFVGPHVPRSDRLSKLEEKMARFTNIFVKNIKTDVTVEEFREHFEKYGEITSAAISTDEAGVSKGFGFVNYEDHDSARKAVEELHDSDFHGQNLFVSRAQKKQEREQELRRQYEQARAEIISKYQGVNIFIKNLEDDVDDERLRQEFSVFGIITSAKVMRAENGISRGFGFVCFSLPDEASKAITEMNGRMWGNKPIYVALHQRNEERRHMLSQRKQGFNNFQPTMSNQYMPQATGNYAIPSGYAAPGQFLHPQMPRHMDWPISGQPGAIPTQYAAGPPLATQYQNQARPMPSRPPRGRNTNQRGNARGGARGAARGGHIARNPRSVSQQQNNLQNEGYVDGQSSVDQSVKLTAASLAAASFEEQKQMLGEALFPQIERLSSSYDAGKITGMLLEMDNAELLTLLEDDTALNSKVSEAVQVLESSDNASAQIEA